MLANGTGYLKHIFQVGRAILVGRCTHGTKDHVLTVQNLLQACGKLQAACLIVFCNKLVKTRLINGHTALFKSLNLILVNVDTCNVDTRVCKTGTCHQTHITSSNNCYIHNFISTFSKYFSYLLPPFFIPQDANRRDMYRHDCFLGQDAAIRCAKI